MGVGHLWPVLSSINAVKTIDCSGAPSSVLDIARAVDGKKFAVDLSIWLCEAQTMGPLMELYKGDGNTCSIKLVFERICTWLRFGVTPVLVVDGHVSQAKAGRLGMRYTAQTGIQLAGEMRVSNSANLGSNALTKRIKALAQAMGVPVVQAPGEAEAACAALDAAGLVDGVQSKDVDSLLFGARRVLKQLRLNQNHKMCEMISCELADVRKALGLKTGGMRALQVMGVLAGGDYNVHGVGDVGTVKALDAVLSLLAQQRDATDDSFVHATLLSALEAGPDERLLGLTNCTGCKTCGHESGCKNARAKCGRGGCAACGTEQGCLPMPPNHTCQCEFHRRKHERLLAKVVKSALREPGVVVKLTAALEEYTKQCEDAARAVKGLTRNDTRWSRRPDCKAVTDLMTTYTQLEWSPEVIRLKLRPVLVEWDLLQGPLGGVGVEWRPTAIQKPQGLSSKDPNQAWQFVLHLERLPGVGDAQEEEQDREWLSGVVPRQVAAQAAEDGEDAGLGTQGGGSSGGSMGAQGMVDDGEEEGEGQGMGTQCGTQAGTQGGSQAGASQQPLGQRKVGKTAPVQQRTFRISLVASRWPELVRAYQQAQIAKQQPKPKAPRNSKGTAAGEPSAKPSGKAASGRSSGGRKQATAEPVASQRASGQAPLSGGHTPTKGVALVQPSIHQYLQEIKNVREQKRVQKSGGGGQGDAAVQQLQQSGSQQQQLPAARDSGGAAGAQDVPMPLAERLARRAALGKQSGGQEQPIQAGQDAGSSHLEAILARRQRSASIEQQQQQEGSPPRSPVAQRPAQVVVDLCTPSPVAAVADRTSGAVARGVVAAQQGPGQTQGQVQGQGQAQGHGVRQPAEVVDLCSSDGEDEPSARQGSPSSPMRQAAAGGQPNSGSPGKRAAATGLASPSKRQLARQPG